MSDSAVAVRKSRSRSAGSRSGKKSSSCATTSKGKSNCRTTKTSARKGKSAKRGGSAAPRKAPQTQRRELTDQELWEIYKKTQDLNLRNVLIERYLPLVRYISERVLQTLPKSIDLDDLVSAGLFGLMDAIEGFDLSRGIKFKTYCTTRIRGAILDELRAQDWVPRLVRLKSHKLEKAVQELESTLGREPTAWELSQKLGVEIDEVNSVMVEAAPKTIFSLSEKWEDGDDDREMEKVDIIEDKKTPDPLHLLHQKDVLELITRHLIRKERLILVMYYYEGLTMREIGDILELTESRVCQIHSNIMQRLKMHLEKLQQKLVS